MVSDTLAGLQMSSPMIGLLCSRSVGEDLNRCFCEHLSLEFRYGLKRLPSIIDCL
jgi:hypothetical protein